ncbi:MAG: hypothetical protein AABX13_02010 [Nanoarchaeota archaeon]
MSWWSRLFPTEAEPKVEVLKDIQVIQESLREVPAEAKILLKELQQLEELEKERQVARESVVPVNLEAQARILDTILQRYEFYQNDVDINGIRVKQVAREFLKKARHAGLKELVNEKKKDMKWQFDW